MQHFWNKKVTAAVAETFFLGWIDEQVLLIQGKEEHLEVLREGWMRRSLKPPAGFQIKCLAWYLHYDIIPGAVGKKIEKVGKYLGRRL
ncbi:storkhead-box protein 1-like [Python bivittatus]|uniref:Storkhead-box protein 1-like n=1 Tax=Python bivittatus TaxID=176946 RepID=A0A9F5IFJ3_PYTBI|nr:storkhead-box protein 1-like [Python bivittatus]